MGEVPQEEVGLLVEPQYRPVSMSRRLVVVCGCAALVMMGYALGSRRSILLSEDELISESGAILTEADFESLYRKVTAKTGMSEAQLTTINGQITGGSPTPTDENVKMLKDWYIAGSNSNKIFANKLIVASMSTASKASTAATSADTDIASAKCPITTYEEFGNWVRDILPAVGAPMSVRKLRDCYKRVLSRAQQKHFTESAVQHMKDGASR